MEEMTRSAVELGLAGPSQKPGPANRQGRRDASPPQPMETGKAPPAPQEGPSPADNRTAAIKVSRMEISAS